MENVEVLAGSPGYLNLMTTQERLATLLVRVSYPGDLPSLSQENYCKILDRTRRRTPHPPPRLRHYEKPDVVLDSMLEGKPRVCRSSLGENEKAAGFSSRDEPPDRCKKSSMRMS